MIERGLVQLYTGDGKGKTTAAIGQIIRALGHGNRAVLVQFMKGSNYYGELDTLGLLKPRVEIFQYGRVCSHNSLIKQGESNCLACGNCFVPRDGATEFDRQYTALALNRSKLALSGDYNLVVLDEILNAVDFGLLSEEDVLNLLKLRPGHVELILTGRNAPQALIAQADLVSEMKCHRHPFEQGIAARRGVEY